MVTNLNFVVSDLSSSQQNYFLIRNLNMLTELLPQVNVQVFCENLSRFCLRPKFAIMNVAEAWGQTGPFVATNLSTAAKTITYPFASKKLFYIWDLEWLRGSNKNYNNYAPIYLHPSLELVCRSSEHKDLTEVAFNREVKHIVDNFDMKQLLEIVNVTN